MNGYYSNRLDELKSRKSELTEQLVSVKLSLRGINKEISKCEEAMNNETSSVNIIKNKDKEISRLTSQNELLKKENLQLKHELQIRGIEYE